MVSCDNSSEIINLGNELCNPDVTKLNKLNCTFEYYVSKRVQKILLMMILMIMLWTLVRLLRRESLPKIRLRLVRKWFARHQ